MSVRYLSLCSGIEAASVAWEPLGWQAVGFSEIEPFPCAVLAHHYPHVPNIGDMTKVHDWRPYSGAVDLVVAGTPCQDFSIAGRRAGLAGERSGLAMVFTQVLSVVRPEWFVWENVPGVFSTNGGRDFGTFIRALDDIGYSCGWRVLDAQFFGVPQRRRRVFVVGHFGNWRPAAAVLFEHEVMCRDTAPSRKAGTNVAGTIKGGAGNRGWESGAECAYIPQIVNQAISCKWSKGASGPAGDEHHNLVATSRRAEGFDASEDGTGRQNLVVVYCSKSGSAQTDGTNALRASEGGRGGEGCGAVLHRSAVRRLTPRECERLQGFPDDYTLIPYRGKSAADCADGPRYRALGNSMAVPVMRWIGERINGIRERMA